MKTRIEKIRGRWVVVVSLAGQSFWLYPNTNKKDAQLKKRQFDKFIDTYFKAIVDLSFSEAKKVLQNLGKI